MSETYKSKRERWQRLLEGLPSVLQEHVSLRNVEAVAALPPQAQGRLIEAIQAGLKRLPRALEQLQIDPNVSISELLDPPAQPLINSSPTGPHTPKKIHDDLIDLIQTCFPDMPRISADAWPVRRCWRWYERLHRLTISFLNHLMCELIL